MSTYDNPVTITYQSVIADASSGGVIDTAIGPKGLTGRVREMGFTVTTAVTTTADVVEVGSFADPNLYAEMTVAIGAADTSGNTFTSFTTDGSGGGNLPETAAIEIAADTGFEISHTGASAAGVVEVYVTVDWF